MSVCRKIKAIKRQICIGDLKDRIEIFLRSQVSKNDGKIKSVMDFSSVATVWAKVTTTRGSQLFDGVELADPFTHEIEIRFRADIDAEKWIDFKGNRYDIVDVQDYDERNEFLLLLCKKKGDQTKEANFA